MTVRVSAEAVEAAAKEYMPSMSHPGHERDEVRAILEAAAPIILRDAVQVARDLQQTGEATCPKCGQRPPPEPQQCAYHEETAALLAAFTREDRHGS